MTQFVSPETIIIPEKTLKIFSMKVKKKILLLCVKKDVKTEFLVTLKYGSEEKGSSLCECSILLGIFMSKN